jgi:hypothetical protein
MYSRPGGVLNSEGFTIGKEFPVALDRWVGGWRDGWAAEPVCFIFDTSCSTGV